MRSHTDGVVLFVEQPEGFHPNPDGQTNQFSWAEGNHLKLFGCRERIAPTGLGHSVAANLILAVGRGLLQRPELCKSDERQTVRHATLSDTLHHGPPAMD